MAKMTDWKRKKLWLEQETSQVYMRLKNTNTAEKQLKRWSGEKKLKAMGYMTPTMGYYPRNGWMGDTDPRSDT